MACYIQRTFDISDLYQFNHSKIFIPKKKDILKTHTYTHTHTHTHTHTPHSHTPFMISEWIH